MRKFLFFRNYSRKLPVNSIYNELYKSHVLMSETNKKLNICIDKLISRISITPPLVTIQSKPISTEQTELIKKFKLVKEEIGNSIRNIEDLMGQIDYKQEKELCDNIPKK